jgi:DNA repair exonuclease SbcCD ATPase subunit
VSLLNSILSALVPWDVPTLLLPGNHDQVVHGGEQHALTPLVAAKDGLFHSFTHPTHWRRALWLPYRRDASLLEECLRQQDAPLAAVFAHVDVAGASMNETHQAQFGLPADLFPSGAGVPTYTGHYHLPHTVPGTRITYVGSPYQVSASEAGQKKRLLLLNSNWQVEASLPLDVGPRHFRLDGQNATPPAQLRSGDRVRWVLPALPGPQGRLTPAAAAVAAAAAPPAVGTLRAKGIDVTLVRAPSANQTAPRIAAADTKAPAELLDAYAKTARLPPAVASAAARLLATLSGSDRGGSGGVPALSRSHVVFEPKRLVLEGYGPFKSRVEYPLGDRGFVVVTGKIVDGLADDGRAAGNGNGDSNGAGKTTLVMAALWALQGSASNARRSDMFVHDGARAARVRLEATLNGQPFWVERAADRKGRLKTFTFGMGDADRSGQDARLTSAALQQVLDVDLLRLTCFHGQHDMERLLTSNDGEFKRALDRLVDLSCWQAAEDAAKERAKAASARADQLGGSLAQLRSSAASTAAALEATATAAVAWHEKHDAQVAAVAVAAELAAREVDSAQQALNAALAALRGTWARASPAWQAAHAAEAQAVQESVAASAAASMERGSHRMGDRHSAEANEAEAAAAARLASATAQAASAVLDLQHAQAAAYEAEAAARGATRAADSFRGVAHGGHDAEHADHALGTCDRCLQPIDAKHFAAQAAQLDSHAATAVAAAETARSRVRDAERTRAAADAARAAAEEELHVTREAVDAAAEQARRRALEDLTSANDRARVAREVRSSLDQRFALAERAGTAAKRALVDVCGAEATAEVHENAETAPPLRAEDAVPVLDAAIADIDAAEQKLRFSGTAAASAAASLQRAQTEMNPHAAALRLLTQQRDEHVAQLASVGAELVGAQEEAALYDAVRVALSDKGIQSYLLEGVALELEAKAAEHLHALSGGSLRLSLYTDSAGGEAAGEEAVAALKRRSTKKAGAGAADAVPPPAADVVVKDKMRLRILTPVVLDDGGGDDGEGEGMTGVTEAERALEQLSGGERRRCALALAIAYAELAAQRGGLRSGLLVLDEALQHLDPSGVEAVCALLRRLDFSTVLLTSQAGSRAVALADSVDYVVKKRGGASSLLLSDGAPVFSSSDDEDGNEGDAAEDEEEETIAKGALASGRTNFDLVDI